MVVQSMGNHIYCPMVFPIVRGIISSPTLVHTHMKIGQNFENLNLSDTLS